MTSALGLLYQKFLSPMVCVLGKKNICTCLFVPGGRDTFTNLLGQKSVAGISSSDTDFVKFRQNWESPCRHRSRSEGPVQLNREKTLALQHRHTAASPLILSTGNTPHNFPQIIDRHNHSVNHPHTTTSGPDAAFQDIFRPFFQSEEMNIMAPMSRLEVDALGKHELSTDRTSGGVSTTSWSMNGRTKAMIKDRLSSKEGEQENRSCDSRQ